MKSKNRKLLIILYALIALLIVGIIYVFILCLNVAHTDTITVPTETTQLQDSPTTTQPETTAPPPETTLPEPERVIATATIGTMGDLLMHKPIFDDLTQYNAAVQQPDGSYDFTSVFQYLSEYTSALDYSVANLETTLCGEDNGYGYSGYPNFNCPDELVDGVKDAGFDMLLTANNHSYDTRLVGYQRTLEVVRGKGLETLGTYLSPDETKWTIADINGIKIGMLCYTWASYVTDDGRPSLNANQPISQVGLCNYFVSSNLPAFYSEVEQYLNEMDAAGAEATIMFIHWGQEYMLSANKEQENIAQKLCDLGIDVIVGGHPHVVQPIDLLESTTDPNHKTVCLYSTGNAVSNQRLGSIAAITTAHTEDGILFTASFEKYSDGTVYLSYVDALPTWVNRYTNENGKTEYNILPLEYARKDEWASLYELEDATLSAVNKSYSRTMEIIGIGLEESQSYLTQQKADREAYYLDLVTAP